MLAFRVGVALYPSAKGADLCVRLAVWLRIGVAGCFREPGMWFWKPTLLEQIVDIVEIKADANV